jgi:hypothetical protein
VRYCIDIDGTICRTVGSDYDSAIPLLHRIDRINGLFDEGHEVVYFTARGTETGVDQRDLTEMQLKLWGARYTTLILGKPAADVYLDDKALSDREFFGDGLGPQHDH